MQKENFNNSLSVVFLNFILISKICLGLCPCDYRRSLVKYRARKYMQIWMRLDEDIFEKTRDIGCFNNFCI